LPIDGLAGADGKQWLDGFYPAIMENSRTGGKTWGIRSSARRSSCTGTRI